MANSEAAPGGVVLSFGSRWPERVIDAVGQAHDLHVGTASVLLMNLEGRGFLVIAVAHFVASVGFRLPGG